MTDDARLLARMALDASRHRRARQRATLIPLASSRTGIGRVDLERRLRARRINWSLDRIVAALESLRDEGLVAKGSFGWGVVSWQALEGVSA